MRSVSAFMPSFVLFMTEFCGNNGIYGVLKGEIGVLQPEN